MSKKRLMMSCEWRQEDDDGDTWSTECNNAFTLNDGTPADNNMKFCCYCSQILVSVPYEREDEQL